VRELECRLDDLPAVPLVVPCKTADSSFRDGKSSG
jgi:hypothetical protein